MESEPESQDQTAEDEEATPAPLSQSGNAQERANVDPTAPRGYGPETDEEREEHDKEVEEESTSGLEDEEEESTEA